MNRVNVSQLRVSVLLAIALALSAGPGWSTPRQRSASVRPDQTLVGMTRLFQALLGVRESDLHRIETAPRDLARQHVAARREGIPLTPREFQRSSPPPHLDAAPVYEQLTRLLKDKPLDQSLEIAASRLGSRYAWTPSDLAAAGALLDSRPEVLALVHQASDRPQCVFRRDWSLGPSLTFPEYTVARGAARLVRTESYLMALDGRYREAIAHQSRGFRIAAHLAPDGVIISYLVGIACEAITLAGFEDILYLAGPNAEIAEQAFSSIAAHRPSYSLRRTLEGEVVLTLATMEKCREWGIRSIYWFSGNDPNADPKTAQSIAEFEKSKEMRRFWRLMVDAGEVDVLERMRRAMAIIERPYPERAKLAKQWSDSVGSPSLGMIDIFRTTLLPVLEGWGVKNQQRVRAQEHVLMAAASVLSYRAKHGAWPERLEQATLWSLRDPFASRPVRYRREADGFVVYSVGEKCQYAGGKPGVPRDRREISFRYPAPPPESASP